MNDAFQILDITPDNLCRAPLCGIKDSEHEGRLAKERWMSSALLHGLRARVLIGDRGVQFGYAEWLPGEHAWRGVSTAGYMFLHCVWTYSRRYQHQGHGRRLIEACLDDARKAGMWGVATVARERPWLAGRAIFLKNGFEPVDSAPPDYDLLVRKLAPSAPHPRFRGDWRRRLKKYGTGLTIVRAAQCPHSIRFAEKIAADAKVSYGLTPRVVTLTTWRDAQAAPTPFAVFAVIYNGEIVADHHVSVRRFKTLLDRVLSRPPNTVRGKKVSGNAGERRTL
jgi:GNAT superfamily N-acetyltransferase